MSPTFPRYLAGDWMGLSIYHSPESMGNWRQRWRREGQICTDYLPGENLAPSGFSRFFSLLSELQELAPRLWPTRAHCTQPGGLRDTSVVRGSLATLTPDLGRRGQGALAEPGEAFSRFFSLSPVIQGPRPSLRARRGHLACG